MMLKMSSFSSLDEAKIASEDIRKLRLQPAGCHDDKLYSINDFKYLMENCKITLNSSVVNYDVFTNAVMYCLM